MQCSLCKKGVKEVNTITLIIIAICVVIGGVIAVVTNKKKDK